MPNEMGKSSCMVSQNDFEHGCSLFQGTIPAFAQGSQEESQ
jgi:hypothetical protein